MTDKHHFDIEGLDPFADPVLGKDLGSFHVEERLGQGGMGTVYRGVHRELGREVAIKTLSSDAMVLGEEGVARFHAEAMAYARLRHRNVVEIYETGEERGIHYLALELVRGATLEDLLEDGGPQSLETMVNVGRQLCEALVTIHAAGLVHRDIKLANVMVDEAGVVKLMDFGVVRARSGAGSTSAQGAAGTLRCMAPEVINGEPGDSRADIFQVGVLLYELATGEKFSSLAPDFHGATEGAFFAGGGAEVRPDLPDAFKEALLRCLQPQPVLRFQSAGALARELENTARLPAGQRSHRRPGDAVPVEPKAPPPQLVEATSFLVRQARLHTETVVKVVLAVLVPLFLVVAWRFMIPAAPPASPDPGGVGSASSAELAPGETVTVRGGLRGYHLKWDLADGTQSVLRGSYRTGPGEPVYVTWPLPSPAGSSFFPVEGMDARTPAFFGWRLERRGTKVAGGSAGMGFQPWFRPSAGGDGTALAVRDPDRLVVADRGGDVHLLRMDEADGAAARRWSFRSRGAVAAMALAGDEVYVALTGTVSTLLRLSDSYRASRSADAAEPVPFEPPGGAEWRSRPLVGRVADAVALVGNAAYVLASTGAEGRSFLLGLSRGDGSSTYTKSFEAGSPRGPLAAGGGNLVFGYERAAKGFVARYDPAGGRAVWRHELDEPLEGELLVDPTERLLVFGSPGHVHGLRLQSVALGGRRLKAVTLGDFRVGLPGPTSRIGTSAERVLMTCLPDGDETPVLLELPAGERGLRTFEKTPLPLRLRGAGDLVRRCPPPVLEGTRVYVPLGDALTLIDRTGRDQPLLVRFPAPLVRVVVRGDVVLAVLEDGSVFRGQFLDR